MWFGVFTPVLSGRMFILWRAAIARGCMPKTLAINVPRLTAAKTVC